MIDVQVKTLDGQNRGYSVPDDMTVKQFKNKIANSINIPANVQRLIYLGRVLQDDKKLNDYDVNGKVIHLVQRPPATSRPATSGTTTGATASSAGREGREGSSYVLGSFTLPSDIMDPGQVQNIVQHAISGMGDIGRNAQITTRSSDDGSSVDVHINLGQIPAPQVQSESEGRLVQARRMLELARETLHRLENPPQPSEESSMETDQPPASSSASTQTSSSASTQSSSSATSTGASETPSSESSSQTNNGQPRTPVQPSSDELGSLLVEVSEFNAQMQPHIERYREVLNDGPTFSNTDETRTAQRLCNLVSEILHYVSHIYHNISDLMIDMNQAPPRNLRAPPAPSPQPAAVIQHSIPVQTQINLASSLPGSPGTQRRQRSATPSSTSTSATPATATSQSTASTPSQPQTGSASSNAQPPPPTSTASAGGANFSEHHEGSPYMFMEVGPHSISINSITAHVVTADSTGTSSTSTTNTGGRSQSSSVSTSTTSSSTSSRQSPSAPPPPPNPAAGPHPRPPGVGIGLIQLPGGHITVGGGPGVHHIRHMGPPQGGAGGGGMPPFLPPNMMDHIIQMATQAAMSRAPGHSQGMPPFPAPPPPNQPTGGSTASTGTASSTNQTTSASTTSASSAPSSGASRSSGSTQTTAGSAGAPRAQAFVIPGAPHMPPHGTTGIFSGPPGPFVSMDMYLPCHSRHFLARRAMGGQGPPADQNPEQTLAGMVSNLVGSLLGQQNPHLQDEPVAPHPPAASRPASTTTTNSTGTVPVNPFAALFSGENNASSNAPAPNFMQELHNILQHSAPPRPNAATESSNPPSDSGAATDEDVFSRLVQGISGYVTQAAMGGQPTDTIADFLSSIHHQAANEEGLLADIFQCLSRHLTIVDLMSCLFGNPAPLQRLRAPLQEFIRERILHGAEYTEPNLEKAIDELMVELRPEMESACNDVEAKDDIDFKATISSFLRIQLRATIHLIMNATDNNANFAASLSQRCRLFMHEFIALCRFCLGGIEPLERLIHGRVRNLSGDINPMIQQWMVSVSTQQLRQMIPNINVTEQQIQHYIIHSHQAAAAVQTRSPMSTGSGSVEVMSTEEVETSSLTGKDSKSESEARSPDQMDVDLSDVASSDPDEQNKSLDGAVNGAYGSVPSPPELTDEDKNLNVEIGSEPWHQAIPLDWVPIISRDIQRQRRQAPTAPFSDAYLNSMPAKRRKVLTDEKPEVDLSHVDSTISSSIRRAAQNLDVQPVTSMNAIKQDTATNQELQKLYKQQVQNEVQDRLKKDDDYKPEKFPNTENQFNKKDK